MNPGFWHWILLEGSRGLPASCSLEFVETSNKEFSGALGAVLVLEGRAWNLLLVLYFNLSLFRATVLQTAAAGSKSFETICDQIEICMKCKFGFKIITHLLITGSCNRKNV